MNGGARIEVDLGERSYPIHIGSSLLGEFDLGPFFSGSQAMVVTNEPIKALYLDTLKKSIPDRITLDVTVIGEGERFKSLETYATVIDELVEKRHNRTTTIVALGGGVVGDLAGFVAATYQRGVGLLQIPTTLLAHVDSSVGGKTAVNHSAGKNLIGAFYQPRCVIADVSTFATLPDKELVAGLAEVIKYGVIFDSAFFGWLEEHVDALVARDEGALIEAVKRSCEIKAEVVRVDERETGLRAILNFGHTFGHAIEALTNYRVYLHGEAVAIGMVLAVDTSVRMGWLDSASAARIRALIARAGLPVDPPVIAAETMFTTMGMDKKVVDGKLRLILAKDIGAAVVTDATPTATVMETLEAGMAANG
ncbi:MAG: 3-dehydroquinate synthase [Gammaproteobacteria bacterium]|nr:3-dehydroquinate synthase [Gammaproteobacteria bacterium]